MRLQAQDTGGTHLVNVVCCKARTVELVLAVYEALHAVLPPPQALDVHVLLSACARIASTVTVLGGVGAGTQSSACCFWGGGSEATRSRTSGRHRIKPAVAVLNSVHPLPVSNS